MKNNFVHYTDAPPQIEKEMEQAVRVDNLFPTQEKFILKKVSKKERIRTNKAWERYKIKDHERGHRKSISEELKEPTKRFDTSIILPESIYQWLKGKPNKAAFIRKIIMGAYSQQK